jgi:hypothetical protein
MLVNCFKHRRTLQALLGLSGFHVFQSCDAKGRISSSRSRVLEGMVRFRMFAIHVLETGYEGECKARPESRSNPFPITISTIARFADATATTVSSSYLIQRIRLFWSLPLRRLDTVQMHSLSRH